MERLPDDGSLLYRAKFLAACLAEDRRSIDAKWTEVENALNRAIRENEWRSRRRRIFYLLLALAIACTIALQVVLRTSGAVFLFGAVIFQSIVIVVAVGLVAIPQSVVMSARFRGTPLRSSHRQPHAED